MQYLISYWRSLLLVAVVAYVVNSATFCEDRTKSCSKWLDKDLCNENPTKYKIQRFYVAMGRLCKKSCEMCGDDDYELMDTDARCNSYSKKGYCDQRPHQGFMLKRCKYSCRNTIRHGITSPGRGNFQRNDPPGVIQQQRQQQRLQQPNAWNHYQHDYTNPSHWGQQYAQDYAQQYGLQYAQQYPQYAQQYAQQNGQQYPQQNTQQPQYAQQSSPQYAQQNDASSQQQQQQPQQQQQQPQQQQQQSTDQSFSSLPVQLQAISKFHSDQGTTKSAPGKQKAEKKSDVEP